MGQVNEDYSEWNVMLQRITVLQEIQEVGVFRAYIYADSPDIKIEEDEESKALTINFKEYRNIGSESAPTFSNLGDSSIKVKYTMEKAGKTGGKIEHEKKYFEKGCMYSYSGLFAAWCFMWMEIL